MDRDSVQMGGDVTDPSGRRVPVHLGGSLMCFGRVPVLLGSGQVGPARPGEGFARALLGTVHVGRVDVLTRCQSGGEILEFDGPFPGGHSRVATERTLVIERHRTSIEARRPRSAGTKVTKPTGRGPLPGRPR